MIEFIDRRGSNCYKWDSDHVNGALPLWVADMDFKAAQPIIDAMQRRLNHGVFGYNITPDAYYDAVSRWFSRRHNWQGISRENIIPTIGVVPALSAVLKALSWKKHKADRMHVLTLTPAYNCFFSCTRNLDAVLEESPLLSTQTEEKELYFKINWADFETKAQTCDAFILCNPHNPTGRVWTKEELSRITEICDKYGVFVISDEIHCELIMPGYKYTPYATVATNPANYCVMTSASKSFNIAGLQCACIFAPDKTNYELIDRAINVHEVCDLNPFGVVAAIAAYNECEDWLKELNALIYQNYLLLKKEIHQLPNLQLTYAEGTYLAWINIEQLGVSAEEFCQQLAAKENILFNSSEMYGCKNFIRVNLATSKEIIEKALLGLKRLIEQNFSAI